MGPTETTKSAAEGTFGKHRTEFLTMEIVVTFCPECMLSNNIDFMQSAIDKTP